MTVTGVIATTDAGLMTVAGAAGLTVMGVDGVISVVGIDEKQCQQAVCSRLLGYMCSQTKAGIPASTSDLVAKTFWPSLTAW